MQSVTFSSLKNKKAITETFAKGIKITQSAIQLKYLIYSAENPDVKVLFTAPKRNFKKAVDRNFLKRRMREAFRLQNKEILQLATQNMKQFRLVFVYISKQKLEYASISKDMEEILQKLSNQIENNQ